MKKINKVLVSVLICGILLSITILAANNSKMIEAFYTGIKLYVDGAEYVPTDANGKVVEPFIYNGTTYLPVRAVANAFGKDVIWDGKTQSVYLGKKDQNQPDAYLYDIQYTDYREGYKHSSFSLLKSNIVDYNGTIHVSGLLFFLHGWADHWAEIDYPLNSQYDTLTGNIVLPVKDTAGSKLDYSQSTVTIIDTDTGEVLFTQNGIIKDLIYNFEIDVRGVNKLTIKVSNQSGGYIALTGLALYE